MVLVCLLLGSFLPLLLDEHDLFGKYLVKTVSVISPVGRRSRIIQLSPFHVKPT